MSFKASESCSAAAPNGSSANEAWQPMLFVSLPLDCSLLNGKTGRSEKSPTTGTHTYFLCQWKAEDCFLLVLLVQSANNWLWQLLLSLWSLGWPWRRWKAKNARVGCRFLSEIIYSLEFHNNFSIIDTESCRNFLLMYALISLSALQNLNSLIKLSTDRKHLV